MQKLAMILLGLSILNPIQTTAGETSCRPIIEAADKEIAARKQEVQLCNLGVQELKDQNTQLTKDVQDRDAKLGSWLHNPWIMAGVGVLVGIFVAKH